MEVEMKGFILIFVIFFELCILSFNGVTGQYEANLERESLLSFKAALENSETLPWKPSLPHCSWHGVTCRLNRVTHLSLSNLSLKGNLSPSLFNLSGLTLLDLSSNNLAGEIPPEIGNLNLLQNLDLSSNFFAGSLTLFTNLKSLNILDISNNSFSGPIPREIGNLKNLTHLYIGINRFSGELPPEFGDLASLESFSSPFCSLTGPFPDEFSKLKSLSQLDLSNNPLGCSIPKSFGELQNLTLLNLVYSELNGTIPAELGNCRNLKALLLSFNYLSGELPVELSELPLVTISAERNQISGPFPSWIGKWNRVVTILLSNNRFSGKIPPEIGNCSRLEQFTLSYNSLMGPIPKEICNAASLIEIDFENNFISGTIDDLFVECRNLLQLNLASNQIGGKIPEFFGEIPLLVINLDSNNFTGSLPRSIWHRELLEFSAANNRLEGHLPSEIGNATSIQRLVLSNNMLNGTIPSEVGNLRAISILDLSSNLFEGTIPATLGNCSFLTTLDLRNNSLNGLIPEEFTELPELQCLFLSHNNLFGAIPSKPSAAYFRQLMIPDVIFVQHRGVFDLSYNRLSGTIPDELGKCVILVNLVLNNNLLSGQIPRSLSLLTNLTTLDLSGNMLTGFIPSEIGNALKLQGLNLGDNQLIGTIPESLSRLSSLVKLNLSGNRLSGPFPPSLGDLKALTHLDLSSNDLYDELPSSLSSMLNLVRLDVQLNRLSGQIVELFPYSMTWKIQTLNLSNNNFGGSLPQTLGNLTLVTTLDLHGNQFTGPIPSEVGDVTQLEYFDVSNNELSGQIPEEICSLEGMFYLNLAENNLEGPVPGSGICQNLSRISLAGNKDLCGRIVGLDCRTERHERSSWGIAGIITISILILLTAAFAMARQFFRRHKHNDSEDMEERNLNSFLDPNLYFLSSSRSKEPLSINISMFERPLLKLPLVAILEATNNFCKTNIIGDGGFGTVYRASLIDGETVAVKKLSKAKTQGHREFTAEMETLGKVKHQNLVPLLGYCTFGEEKLLIYEYMVNGSLDLWLRNRTGTLDILNWETRFKIAAGSACGLAFLHHGFIPHIIHRDIKASNILLNEDFEPKLADFGLARLISAVETHVTTEIAGTLGYIPPEYGQCGQSTIKGDVYSFGVILLELVTGKEPTGPDFKESEGGNLVGWVLQKIKNGRAADTLDPTVLNADSKQMMLQTLQIASLCLSERPANRPTMFQVSKFLRRLKDE